MLELSQHLLQSIVAHPDALQFQVVEGDAVTIVEVVAHAEDRALLEGEDGRILRNVRQVLSAAAGSRKATLELVESFSDPSAEEE